MNAWHEYRPKPVMDQTIRHVDMLAVFSRLEPLDRDLSLSQLTLHFQTPRAVTSKNAEKSIGGGHVRFDRRFSGPLISLEGGDRPPFQLRGASHSGDR